jgi:peptide-methionine (S)-S-oxide reductase
MVEQEAKQTEVAVLGGGCFWCIEPLYDSLQGVISVESGYMGGHVPDPTYKQVCRGDTGHVEVIRVAFDPSVVSYRDILEVFFASHDPTTLNRQGADAGTQYRSVIFTMSTQQRETALALIVELEAERAFASPIVTAVEEAAKFYMAEDYHQEYYANNPYQPYCMAVISPKLAKFRAKFANRLKP